MKSYPKKGSYAQNFMNDGTSLAEKTVDEIMPVEKMKNDMQEFCF